ncbi:ATPase family associated with various cellular activities (AAA) [Pustulibacterium marinum]|uniref:ATPase family associated with various cellular activities (AAA) n=1 Tax=Pustulibacterium marinum TaxID=1224947 RepID=A0A1I7HJ27_9FLAO|nr:AAA family ATPase [Pustulibacterium marinum]SFU60695.1 ATPase family associated with various cellular activities (AAA) [Pustulibacterium marinum]
MAAAEKIIALLKSYGDNDESRFYSTAMQIAASEAKKGHVKLAQELKILIEDIKKQRNTESLNTAKTRILHVNEAQKELHDLLELHRSNISLKNMVLNEEVSESLYRIIHEQRKYDQLLQHNLQPRKKLLLVGPPGCGKTMTAKALAGELKIPLFLIRLDGLISRYMGESIAKLKLIFDSMYQHRAVYLFDEFDSIGANRNYGNDVGEIKRVLNSFLMNIEKDESTSIIIAATNLPESLDKALFRRFDDIIQYPLPSKEEIMKLLKTQLKGYKGIDDNYLLELADISIGLSYADISNACKDAIKEMIVFGENEISYKKLLKFIQSKKYQF